MESGMTGGPPPIESLRDGHGGAEHAPPRRKSGGGEGSDGANDHGGRDAAGGDAHAEGEATAVTIAGLSADKLSPDAERVIEQLLAELGQMRAELDVARRRLAQIEQVVDHHPFLPVFSREAFRRQIAHVLGHIERLPQSPGLLIVSLLNGDAIRRAWGLAARDQALRHLCEAVRATLHPSDILGSLTGNDLALLMFIENEAIVHERAEALIQAVAERPFLVGERRIDCIVGCGTTVLSRSMDVDGAIAAADDDLISGFK